MNSADIEREIALRVEDEDGEYRRLSRWTAQEFDGPTLAALLRAQRTRRLDFQENEGLGSLKRNRSPKRVLTRKPVASTGVMTARYFAQQLTRK